MNNPNQQQANKPKRQMMFCEPCGFKKIIDFNEQITDLFEVKTSPIQLKIPSLDPVSQKTVQSKFQPQAPRYKCPKCGRLVKVKELLPVYSKLFEQLEQQKVKQKQEEEMRKRLEDGKPVEKKPDPEFTG